MYNILFYFIFNKIIIYRLYINQTSSNVTLFHYSDLIKVQSKIEDHFKMTSGINISKLKLKAFDAPKVASINISGKVSYIINSIFFL